MTIPAIKNSNNAAELRIECIKSIEGGVSRDLHIQLQISHFNNERVFTSSIFVNTNPTGNCQSWIMAYVNQLITYLQYCSNKAADDEKSIFGHKVIHAIRKEIIITFAQAQFKKRQLLIDYNKDIAKKIEIYFHPTITIPYTSTNSSQMVLGMIVLDPA